MNEEIYCPTSGKLLARISISNKTLYLFCKYHHMTHAIPLDAFIDRIMKDEPAIIEDHDEQGNLRKVVS